MPYNRFSRDTQSSSATRPPPRHSSSASTIKVKGNKLDNSHLCSHIRVWRSCLKLDLASYLHSFRSSFSSVSPVIDYRLSIAALSFANMCGAVTFSARIPKSSSSFVTDFSFFLPRVNCYYTNLFLSICPVQLFHISRRTQMHLNGIRTQWTNDASMCWRTGSVIFFFFLILLEALNQNLYPVKIHLEAICNYFLEYWFLNDVSLFIF